MSSGMERLNGKHAKKKQKVVQLSEEMLAILSGDTTKSQKKTNPEKSDKAKITQFSGSDMLAECEQDYLRQICDKLHEIYGDDIEKYRMAAINLSKLYILGKKIESAIEADGGMFLEEPGGKIYAHPGVKMLQSNHANILQHLRSLGLVHREKPGVASKRDVVVSEFSQFA